MTSSSPRLRAIITGASSGIGKATALAFADTGIAVALVSRSVDKLTSLAQTIRHRGGEAQIYPLDLSQLDRVKDQIAAIASEFGPIDILVNSAGITGNTNIKSHETVTDNVQQVFDVNFMGSYFTSKYVLPFMIKNKYGRILHIASIAGKEGNAGMLAYSASKAAVIGMTKVQGKEYAEMGITINALAPAVIKTALVDAMPEEQVNYMTSKIPMKRCGTLEEATNLALYIVSPSNSFTTGFTFDLSGGRATY
jgi:3-oxoacyl-[acyl-carrier protein] reductase